MSKVEQNVPLAPLTTFAIGGAAEFFTAVSSEAELIEALIFARKESLPVTVLGGGSNVLVDDEGVKGLVIKNNIRGIDYADDGKEIVCRVGAGEVFDDLVADTVKKDYWGLENLSRIPGSVGATPIQNVGAYGVEVGDLISEVVTINKLTHEKKVFKNNDCQFKYRDSFFKTTEGKEYVVVSTTFLLSNIAKPKLEYKDLKNYFSNNLSPTIVEVRDAVSKIRSQKFPDWKVLGTAGSFFKNPIVNPRKAAELLEAFPDWPHFQELNGDQKFSLSWFLDNVLGLKGKRHNNVGTYHDHVLVMVNYGGATAEAVTQFATEISDAVFEKTNLTIDWEVTRLG